MSSNPFETLGLDPLLIAELKESRCPDEFKKFLKGFRDSVAMALHPDRITEVKSTYFPALLDAYDKIKNLDNGNLDRTVEDFLKIAAKDGSKDLLVKLEQLAIIVENLEQVNEVAQKRIVNLEERLAKRQMCTEEADSAASTHHTKKEMLSFDIRKELSEYAWCIKSLDSLFGLEQIGDINARGKIFLGSLFREYELKGTDEYFHRDGLHDIIRVMDGYVKGLKKRGLEPKYFGFEFFRTYTYSNCHERYAWMANFFRDATEK